MRDKQYKVVGVRNGQRFVITADCSRAVARATARASNRGTMWDRAFVEARTVTQWTEVEV